MDVKMNVQGLEQLQRELRGIARENPKLARSVLKRTGDRAIGRARKWCAKYLQVPAKIVKRRFANRLERTGIRTELWVGLKRAIKASELGGRAHARMLKNHGADAFRATSRFGKLAWWVRKGTGHKVRPDGQYSGLPIKELAMEIPAQATQVELERLAEEQLRTYFAKELGRRIQVQANKRG